MRSSAWWHLLLLLLLALPTCAPGGGGDSEDSQKGPPGHGPIHWSYTDKAQWASDFAYCGGQMQSPINIDTTTTFFTPQLEPVLLSGYNLPPEKNLSLRNNGHTRANNSPAASETLKKRGPPSSTLPCSSHLSHYDHMAGTFWPFPVVLKLPANMSVSGGGFLEAYDAAQLHLHWGSKEEPGSEHTVDGHRYAGEIHVVHYLPHFGSFYEAAREPGGLAVLAAFLQVGSEENEAYQHILEHLDDIHEEDQETLIAGFDIAKLLPANLASYFHYNGSLTTPPCYQTVNWTVFNQTVLLSQEQISVLEESLLGKKEQLIHSNFRLPQSLHDRRVLASFLMPPTPPVAEPPEAGKQVDSSLRAGDLLAVLFGTLFGLTAIAFLLYVHKHRCQNQRLNDQGAKPSVIYVPATTTEEPMG